MSPELLLHHVIKYMFGLIVVAWFFFFFLAMWEYSGLAVVMSLPREGFY